MFSLHHWECTASHCKPHYNEPLRHVPVNITISKMEQSKKHLKPVFTLVGNPAKIKGAVLNSNPSTQHFKAHTEEAADSGSRCACTSGAAVQESSKQDHQNTRSKKPRQHNLPPWPFFTLNQYLSHLQLHFLIPRATAKPISQLQIVAVAPKHPAFK